MELPEEPEPTDGPSVPFRLTEAKLGHEQTGDQPYFGRINMKACVARDSVHLYVYVYVHRQTDQTRPDQTRPGPGPDQTRQIQTNIQNTNVYIYITSISIYVYNININININIYIYIYKGVDLSSAQHTLVTTGWAGSITYI